MDFCLAAGRDGKSLSMSPLEEERVKGRGEVNCVRARGRGLGGLEKQGTEFKSIKEQAAVEYQRNRLDFC